MFLTPDDLRILTARAHRAGQIEALKRMGIPYWVNAAGWPVVARAAVEGGRAARQDSQPDTWTPKPLRHAA